MFAIVDYLPGREETGAATRHDPVHVLPGHTAFSPVLCNYRSPSPTFLLHLIQFCLLDPILVIVLCISPSIIDFILKVPSSRLQEVVCYHSSGRCLLFNTTFPVRTQRKHQLGECPAGARYFRSGPFSPPSCKSSFLSPSLF